MWDASKGFFASRRSATARESVRTDRIERLTAEAAHRGANDRLRSQGAAARCGLPETHTAVLVGPAYLCGADDAPGDPFR